MYSTHKSTLVSSGWSLSALHPKADIRQRIEHVCFCAKSGHKCPASYFRFTPNSGHSSERVGCQISAISDPLDGAMREVMTERPDGANASSECPGCEKAFVSNGLPMGPPPLVPNGIKGHGRGHSL